MASRLNPYLSFDGNAREAAEAYRDVFGGELRINTFGDYGSADDESLKDKIMHGQLETPGGLVLMGADTPASMERAAQTNISVSISGQDLAEMQGYWDKLADGGTVLQPFADAPWGARFGMLNDRFGTPWLVNCGPETA